MTHRIDSRPLPSPTEGCAPSRFSVTMFENRAREQAREPARTSLRPCSSAAKAVSVSRSDRDDEKPVFQGPRNRACSGLQALVSARGPRPESTAICAARVLPGQTCESAGRRPNQPRVRLFRPAARKGPQ